MYIKPSRLRAALFGLLLSWGLGTGGWAADLIQQVPVTSPAYGQLRLLGERGLLSPTREVPLADLPERALTRYDVALLLIEPLERCCALLVAQESAELTPDQARRKELACIAFAPLPPEETVAALMALDQLLVAFRLDVEELAPGLPQRASDALLKLRYQFARVVRQGTPPATPGLDVTISLNPKSTPENIGSPLPLLSPRFGNSPTALAAQSSIFRPDETEGALLGTRPINSLEAAVDIAFNRFRVYGALASLPGQDILQWINLKGPGTYKLGFEMDFGNLKAVSISGILEYHYQRTVEADDTIDTNTGAVGGISIRW